MKDIIVVGAGGFGREIAQLIKDINQDEKEWNFLGYIDENPEKHGMVLNGDLVLGGFEWFEENWRKGLWAVCGVGSSVSKRCLVDKATAYNVVNFPNLIHPTVLRNDFIELGIGNIICANSILSVNIKLGSHVAINPGCKLGHDTIIKDYSTLMWDVTIAGNVLINEGCEIGSKAAIIQQKSIGKNSIIGAGAVVVSDIPDKCTAVGVPAKPIKFFE